MRQDYRWRREMVRRFIQVDYLTPSQSSMLRTGAADFKE